MTSKTEQLQQLYQAVLDYKSEIDEDGYISFHHPDMGMFYISLDAERDPEFMRLVFPHFADDTGLGLTRTQMLEFANEVNISNKAAKLTVSYISSDNTWNVSAQIESFLASADTFPDETLLRDTMNRNISAIRASLSSFIEATKAANSADEQQGDNI